MIKIILELSVIFMLITLLVYLSIIIYLFIDYDRLLIMHYRSKIRYYSDLIETEYGDVHFSIYLTKIKAYEYELDSYLSRNILVRFRDYLQQVTFDNYKY